MSESKVRIRFEGHEFEAEGAAEEVRFQLSVFRDLVAPKPAEPVEAKPSQPEPPPLALNTILRHSGDVVSVTAEAEVGDAILLMMLGHRNLRRHDIISGSQIMNGLRQSGIDLPRVDMHLKKHARQGSIIATGIRRTRRYQLSVTGLQRAQQIARRLEPLDPEPPKP